MEEGALRANDQTTITQWLNIKDKTKGRFWGDSVTSYIFFIITVSIAALTNCIEFEFDMILSHNEHPVCFAECWLWNIVMQYLK